MAAKHVGTVLRADLQNGAFVRLPYAPFDVLVSEVDGVVSAIEDACNHGGASLSEGPRTKDGKAVVCPLHGYVFDLRSGKLRSPRGLCADQRTFEIRKESDESLSIWDTFEVELKPA